MKKWIENIVFFGTILFGIAGFALVLSCQDAYLEMAKLFLGL